MRTKTAKKPELPKAEGVPVVVMTVDTLINLVDRINKLEGRLVKAETSIQENFDYMVDAMPTVMESGAAMQQKAFMVNGDDPVIVEVACRQI